MQSMVITVSVVLPDYRNCAASTSRSSPPSAAWQSAVAFELMLSADLIYAADHSTFALPEINAGTLADAATIKLPKRIPYHIAMEMLYRGRWME